MATITNNNFDDTNIWTDQEIQQLLSIIDDISLAKDLVADNFSPTVVDVIKNGFSKTGYYKTYEQVENVLMSLKIAYLNSKEAISRGINTDICPYYDLLDRIWSSCNDSNLNKKKIDAVDENMPSKIICTSRSLHGKILNQKSTPWSDNETAELLNLIDRMNLISDFRHRLSPKTIKKLVLPLLKRGYTRTCNQIIGKMRSMRETYLKCVRSGRTSQAVNNCPFFDVMDRMFQRSFLNNNSSSLQPIDHDYENKFETSIDPSYNNTQKLNESGSTWRPLQLFADSGGTSFQSIEALSNDEKDDSFEGGEFGETTLANGKSNVWDNSPMEIENNLDVYLDSSTDCQTVNDETNETYSLRNRTNISNINKKQLKTRILRSNIPKYIRVVKGKTKYILKKIDAPQHEKSDSTTRSHERSYSPIKKTTFQPMKSSPLDTDKPTSPIKITMTKKFKNKTMPYGKLPVQLDSTCSQTDSTDIDSLSETMKIIMKQILTHQKQMQQQHHEWMEKQFEIQRKHNCEQQQILLEELREFRRELRDVTEKLFTD